MELDYTSAGSTSAPGLSSHGGCTICEEACTDLVLHTSHSSFRPIRKIAIIDTGCSARGCPVYG